MYNILGKGRYEQHQAWLAEQGLPHDERGGVGGVTPARLVFIGANLIDADLRGADLRGADLRGAYLRGAYLRGANLSGIRSDVRNALESSPTEVPALRSAIAAGLIDGGLYEGECACLVGTLEREGGNPRPRDSESPAERWFLAIREGDTPQTNPVSAITLKWVDEWLSSR